MKRHESTEDYLETIFRLKTMNGIVRSIDIVNDMGFSKPSISVAMKKLRQQQLIDMDDSGYISLTALGTDMAKKVYERHTLLTEMLMSIGVSEDTAKADACRIEHDISDETFEKIKEHMKK